MGFLLHYILQFIIRKNRAKIHPHIKAKMTRTHLSTINKSTCKKSETSASDFLYIAAELAHL